MLFIRTTHAHQTRTALAPEHTKQGLRLPQNMRIKKANLQTTVSRIILIFWLNEWGIIQLHVNCDQESKLLKLEGVFVLYYIGGDPVHYGWVG